MRIEITAEFGSTLGGNTRRQFTLERSPGNSGLTETYAAGLVADHGHQLMSEVAALFGDTTAQPPERLGYIGQWVRLKPGQRVVNADGTPQGEDAATGR